MRTGPCWALEAKSPAPWKATALLRAEGWEGREWAAWGQQEWGWGDQCNCSVEPCWSAAWSRDGRVGERQEGGRPVVESMTGSLLTGHHLGEEDVSVC